MHPVVLFAMQSALTSLQAAPTDSVIWLPFAYDGLYAEPRSTLSWSPDDQRIAFAYFEYTPPQYFDHRLVILQGDHIARECPLGYPGLGAAWSPIGDEIAVNISGEGLYVIVPDSCLVVRPIVPRGLNPRWSRDGQRIAFDDASSVRTASAFGGDERLVVGAATQPDWSPDGRFIVFVRRGNLWTVSADGTNERQITDAGSDEWPAWSPNGRYIAFTRSEPDWEHMAVWLVGASGGPATQVSPVVAGEQRARPSWSNDGTRLAYFVLAFTRFRVGVAINRDWRTTAARSETWSAVKKAYR